MRDERRSYVLVGAFVIAMAVALAIWLVLLVGSQGATDRYSIVYRSVMGLQTGGQILYEGFPVGFIESIEPFEDGGLPRYRVQVSVREGWPIPVDSVATVTAPNLLSGVVIDIRNGTSPERLEPGSEIPGRESVDVVDAVNEVAAEAVDLLEASLKPLLQSLSTATPAVLENVGGITEELNRAVGQLNTLLGPGNVGRIERILSNVEGATGDFDGLIGELDAVRKDVAELAARANALLAEDAGDLSTAVADLNHSLDAVARHIDGIAANLEATSRNLNEFSQSVRDNPGVLLRGRDAGDAP